MDYNYEIITSPLATNDLIEIFDYIKNSLFAEKAAENLIQKIMQHVDQLSTAPEMYPELDNPFFRKKAYRKIIVNNYVVIYSVDHTKQKVNIIRAFYGAMDYEKYL